MQSPELLMYRQQWKLYHGDAKDSGAIYAWRKHGALIEAAWICYIRANVRPVVFSMLSVFLDKWQRRRNAWLVYGGYFYTLRGKRRRKLMEKHKPACRLMSDEIGAARDALSTAVAVSRTTTDVRSLLLSSGCLYEPDIPKDDPAYTYDSTKKMEFSERFSKPRWWNNTTDVRLAYMVERGMLRQPDGRVLR